MLTRIIFAVLFITLTATMLAQNRNVAGSVAFSVEEKDLIPEGIAYDPQSHQFFLSSINKEKIVVINEKGEAADFIRTGEYGILQTLGMKVDMARRRLWVVSNKEINGKHFSAVHIFNVDSKALIKKFILEKDTLQLFNDLVLTDDGGAYITDTYSGIIYTVTPNIKKLKPFIESDSLLKWSNGLALSPGNKFLYVATGSYITFINLKTRFMEPLKRAENVSTSGIDGLVFYKGSLIGIVNNKDEEIDMYIVRYQLSPALQEIKEFSVIDRGNPLFNLPTTCVLDGDNLYCLASTSLRMFFQDRTDEKKRFQNPLVLKYSLGN